MYLVRVRRKRTRGRSCATYSRKSHFFFVDLSLARLQKEKKTFISLPLSLSSSSLFSSFLFTWLNGTNRAQKLELHLFVAAAEPPQDAVPGCALGGVRRSEGGPQQRLYDRQGLAHDRDV